MKKKYIKPEIKEFISLTGTGQYPEGVCIDGGQAAGICDSGQIVHVTNQCNTGPSDANLCNAGFSPGTSHCMSGESAEI